MTTTADHPTAETPPPPADPPRPPRPHRRWRRRALIGTGVAVVVVGASWGVDCLVRGTDHHTEVFSDRVTTVDARLSAGSLRIVPTDDPNVTVEEAVRGGVRSPSHSERVDGETLVLRSSCSLELFSPSCEVDYVVHVPQAVRVVAHGDGADFDLDAVTGDVDVSVNGGSADVRFVEAPTHVKGRANGGRVTVEIPRDDATYQVDADANGGSAHADVRTDPLSERIVDLHANGGSVTVRYATAR
jgi:hypothetical protein